MPGDSWSEDGFDYVRRQSPPSSVVSTLAVLSIVYGSLGLFCSGFAGLFLLLFLTLDAAQNLPQNIRDSYGLVALVTCVGYLLTCVLGIVGGVGIVSRQAYGRRLVIAVGFLQLALLGFYAWVFALLIQSATVEYMHLVMFGFPAAAHAVFGTYSLAILMRRRYAEEFP